MKSPRGKPRGIIRLDSFHLIAASCGELDPAEIKIAYLRWALDQNQSKIEKMTENRASFLHLGVIL